MTGGEAALVRSAVERASSWRGRRPPVRQLVEAMLRGDAVLASELSGRFLARAGSRVAVFADLLQPAQYEVGERWYRGRIGIDGERRTADILERLVAVLPRTPARSPVPPGSRCLLTVLPGEQHTLGLAMFALAMEDEGWAVELLDDDYLPHDLPELVDRVRPRLVGISTGYLTSVHGLAQVVAAIRRLSVPVLVGGPAFNRAHELWRRVGAHGHGADARIGTVLARRLARASGG
jgi:methanogenic corrinoid protein MtbC1